MLPLQPEGIKFGYHGWQILGDSDWVYYSFKNWLGFQHVATFNNLTAHCQNQSFISLIRCK